MLNEAIIDYYEKLIKNDDICSYDFLYPLYTDPDNNKYLSDKKFTNREIVFDKKTLLNYKSFLNIRDEIITEVNLDDVLPYLTDNAKLILNTETDQNNKNFTYEDTFENFEYYADYNYLMIGPELLNELKINYPNKIKCKLGLYNVFASTGIKFIDENVKNFVQKTDIPDLILNIPEKGKYNKFILKNYINLFTSENMSIPALLVNLPYSFYKKAFLKSTAFYYDIKQQDYFVLHHNSTYIQKLLSTICTDGVLNPLPLGINDNGKIVDITHCNNVFIIALLLQLPTIPVILYKHFRNHYTNDLEKIKNDLNSLDEANQIFYPYVRLRAKHFKDSFYTIS